MIATLWAVADKSTGELMRRFYELREREHLTKAEALRQAQLSLLSASKKPAATPLVAALDEARGAPCSDDCLKTGATQPTYTPPAGAPYAHPYYWAPFILMGNWL